MPPALTPAARRRNQYLTNIGDVGRQTGIQVPERERGSDGMEPLEDFYTSPATGRRSRMTSERRPKGPALEPQDVLSAGRSSMPRGRAPPPGRSPVRTPGLGPAKRGSLLRSVSPTRSEAVSTARPAKLKRLDFSKSDGPEHATPTTESRDRRSMVGSAQSSRRSLALSQSPERPRDGPASRMSDYRQPSEELDAGNNDVSIAMEETEIAEMGEDVEDSYLGLNNGVGGDLDEAEDTIVDSQIQDVNGEESIVDVNGGDAEPSVVEEAGAQQEAAPKRRRGRPPKAKPAEPSRPAARTPAAKPTPAAKTQPAKTNKRKAPEPKDPRSAREGTPGLLQRVREQTPHDPDAGLRTRVGRISFKPLAYWKGERAVFRAHAADREVEQIIRMDDVTPVKRTASYVKRGQTKRRKVGRSRLQSEVEEDQDDEPEEPWELDQAVIAGPVRVWNQEEGAASTEEIDEDLAFASGGIQARQVPGAQFLFAKTLTRSFFGTGIVELPPQGFKSWKCSRAFQMVFFVHFGKVVVEIAATREAGVETRFAISKGGTWQVPRGNFYAIHNETKYPAKLFFAQGREMHVPDGGPAVAGVGAAPPAADAPAQA